MSGREPGVTPEERHPEAYPSAPDKGLADRFAGDQRRPTDEVGRPVPMGGLPGRLARRHMTR